MQFMRIRFFMFFFALLGAIESFSQNKIYVHPIDLALENCLSVSEDQTIGGKIECEYTARMAWDKEMSKYYKLLVEVLKPVEKKSFKESQRDWVVYRDDEMNFASALYKNMEGSSWLLVHAKRLTAIVKQRALELEEYYEMASFDPD